MKRTAAYLLAPALAAVLSAFAAPAGAALFEDDEARKAILDLRGRVDQSIRNTNQQLGDLGRSIGEINARLDRLEQASRGQLTLQNELETLRQELARLRGQVEVQTNELAQTQRQQREALATVDSRLKRFEPVTVQLDGRNVTVDQTERRTYEAALAQFRGGDFRAALASFQQFQTQYPESAYAPNVMFWIGSVQFALKDYKSAITTHTGLVSRFPESPRVPDALLNLGYAQVESGDRRAGRKSLETIVEKYPDSSAAQNARERLASLR